MFLKVLTFEKLKNMEEREHGSRPLLVRDDREPSSNKIEQTSLELDLRKKRLASSSSLNSDRSWVWLESSEAVTRKPSFKGRMVGLKSRPKNC